MINQIDYNFSKLFDQFETNLVEFRRVELLLPNGVNGL